MRWHDLLFMHWPISTRVLRPLVPESLVIDTYEGQAWIGVVPFRMSGVSPRCVPPLPGISAFPELNVRTYVTAADKPGVWFFSLDAASRLAVRMARWSYHLPYFHAKMSLTQEDGWIHYSSSRIHSGAPAARFVTRYRPKGEIYRSEKSSIDHWLTERYCLYTTDHKGRLLRGQIHHAPWPLQPAQAQVETNTMTSPLGIELPDSTPLLHYARRLEVVAWLLEKEM